MHLSSRQRVLHAIMQELKPEEVKSFYDYRATLPSKKNERVYCLQKHYETIEITFFGKDRNECHGHILIAFLNLNSHTL